MGSFESQSQSDWSPAPHSIQVIMEIELKNKSVLLRYVSEWDPRSTGKTKGGYMEGNIRVPREARRMILQTLPDQEYANKMERELGHKMERELGHFGHQLLGSVHPLLLHVVRMGKGRRDNEKEPVPTFHHWRQEFVIDKKNNVRIINKASELDVDRNIPVSEDDDDSIVTKLDNQGCIVLGKQRGEVNLIALQPKQDGRAKSDEATLTKVLRDRLHTDDKHLVQSVEKLFKRDNINNLKKFRIKADFYDETGSPVGFAVSETIRDTGNKNSGSMDLHDVSAQRSCTRGGRKIFMESEYSLAKDVLPVFQVYDEAGNHWPKGDMKLNQPGHGGNQVKVRNNAIHIITPEQKPDTINQLALDNKKIFLRFKRHSDGYCSPNKVPFQYDLHQDLCLFCDFYPDTPCDGVKPDLASGLEAPKPRKRKRVLQPEEGNNFLNVPRPRTQLQMSESSSDYNSCLSSPESLRPHSPYSGSDSDMLSNHETDLRNLNDLNEMIGTEELQEPAGMAGIADGLFEAPSLEISDIPTVVKEMSAEQTLDTPQPMLESFNSLNNNFSSLNPFLEQGERSTPFTFTRREDVVSDCSVKQDRPQVQIIQPEHHQELQEQPARRPTLRVEPWKREAETSLDSEEEEEGKKGWEVLSYFPHLVVAVILVVMLVSMLGLTSHHVIGLGLATLTSVGAGALYQRHQGDAVSSTSSS